MKAAIFFATREGHTCRVAEHIADDLRDRGVSVDLFNVNDLTAPIDWSVYRAACVAASVRAGRHEREIVAFVRRHRADLERLSAAFVSVTLSEAGAEDVRASPEQRAEAAENVRRMIDRFEEETGWQPAKVLPVAGALAYRRYNFVVRFVMQRIARNVGAPTDTSRNWELTNWPAVDRFVDEALRPTCARN
jgi:menaquinone-dependent protoporphyrinogen oxidase